MPFSNGATQRNNAIMTTRLTIDSAGRVVIPKLLRDELGLAPGDTLDLEAAGESITLRPTRGTAPLTKEKGVWVFRIGRPLPASVADDVVERIRDDRDRHILKSHE
jgi:AbrB family looped-hinge helix DNA binding protein